MNKFHHAILLFSLVILLVILVSVIFMKRSSVENSLIPKNTRAISSNGECSVANCGQSGKSYRRAICTDPNGNQIDDSNCDPITRDFLEKDCTNPACAPWNYSAWTPPCDACINMGSPQSSQTRTVTNCSSTTDPVYGCDPSQQQITRTCSSPVCGPNSYHNMINGTFARSTNLFSSDSSTASGNLANNINISGYTITFYPTGNMIYGAYFCTFVYYQTPSSSGNPLAISSSENIKLINLFSSGSTTPYPISPNVVLTVVNLIVNMMIVIIDPTKISRITFNTTGGPKTASTKADIFVTQMNSSILKCISGQNLVPCTDTYVTGRYPYLAIYRGTGGVSPLDSAKAKNYLNNPLKVFDSFDTSLTFPWSSTYQSIVIPILTNSYISSYSKNKFLMLLQLTTSSAITTFSITGPTSTNLNGELIFSGNTLANVKNSIAAVANNQALWLYCFSIVDITKTATINFTTTIASNISGFDLVIVQLDAATV